eukprot:TRINITY_DN39164_c0_g1_i1.p1 TRINITY_DN39164_c0_g1~~TRINITY_DN39164_c0_g1_i1.p1  ORF type:complete len:568 (+),score=159.46 TRINITY_DN39164_c0_g1_i1:93-1796(+)
MARVEGSVMTSESVGRLADVDTAYQKVPIRQFPRRPLGKTTEEKRWAKFSIVTDIASAMRGRVSSIDYCKRWPHHVVVTSQTRVALYDPRTHETVKETHPKDTVHCTRWRGDGRLLVTCGEQPTIKVWTAGGSIKKMVRQLSADLERGIGHTRAVHTVSFFSDNQKVLSGGDDKVACVWDMPTQEQVAKLEVHTDYVRAASPHPFNADICCTAGHDGKVCLWDLRAAAKPQRQFEVPDPASCVVYHPSGGLVVVASGADTTVWDVAGASTTPASLLSNHTKDVTSVCFNEEGSRLLTGSVDRHVKVYETELYTTAHTMTFPEPVFSVGISPCGSSYAVGTLEGKLHLRSRPNVGSKTKPGDDDDPDAEVQLYDGLGQYVRRRVYRDPFEAVSYKPSDADYVVEAVHQKQLRPFDRAFRRFAYAQALNDAVDSVSRDGGYAAFHSVVEELIRRNGLRIALAGRTAQQLVPILELLRRGLTDPRYCQLVSTVLSVILEIYHPVVHQSDQVYRLLKGLRVLLHQQCQALSELTPVQGALDSLLQLSEVRDAKRRRVAEDMPTAIGDSVPT